MPAVLNDLKTAIRTAHAMGIPKENLFQLVNADHAQMEEAVERLMDMIKASSLKLSGPTCIGSNIKFRGGI